jgi:hypothetical protein
VTSIRSFLFACLLLLVLVVPAPPARAASSNWEGVIDITFPVTGDDHRYMDDYHQSRSRGAHGSTDIMAPSGTPIVAAEGGRITWMSTPASSGCGYCLDITDSNGRTFGYIHLGPNSAGQESKAFSQSWREGDTVRRGQAIGYVGCSGNASCSSGGHHLHFQIKDPGVRDPYGDARRNPYPSLRAAERACDPNSTFEDVCAGSTHEQDIMRLATGGLTKGCGDRQFCPKDAVTRAEMASFLVRALDLTGTDQFPFRDVGEDNVHHRTIARLAAEEITAGCDDDLYCPGDAVTREQMASFLVRALSLTPRDTPRFSDVPAGSTHARDISALATAGITKGCSDDRYCPDDDVTREQMASFLVRAFLD